MAVDEGTGEKDLVVPKPPVRRTVAVPLSGKIVGGALVVGILGGLLGAFVFVHYLAAVIPTDHKQLVVQESSAEVDVAKTVSPSVVSITSKAITTGFFGTQQQSASAGTGMIVSADGLILTNRHVVDDSSANYTVVTSDGKTYLAKVVSRDSINDVAFVRISATNLKPVALGDSGAVQVGQRVVAIGNALGQFQNTVTSGIISGLSRGVTAGDSGGSSASTNSTEALQNLLQTDAAINPGNSGGPLVNLDGQVVGMDTAVAGQGSQNIGFAIPINDIRPLIDSVKSQGRIVRPYLGIRFIALDTQVAQQNSLPVSNGAWVQAADDQNPGVVVGSPADKAGVKDGDIIVKVNNNTIDATHSLQSLVGKFKVGDKVTLDINRAGKSLSLSITLEAAPAS
jgi:serine protease Do